MAKYTLLLSEYLKDGFSLPSSFSLIDGFADLFAAYYCDKEIGFETEELFEIKLNMRAELIMQSYAEKIAERAKYWAKIDSPAKTFYSKESVSKSYGKQKSQGTELPFNAAEATPNTITESDAYNDSDERVKETRSDGQDLSELMKILDYLNKDVSTLTEKCLNEFSSLFMKVY